ncbi:hypothetical protein JK2ML_1763 [Mycobacterium leprae Kyoto-2]|uniref:Uncharacterized protein n=2 Tax=Mycobacterium leprae TaxID=1769 RepID=Q9CBN9_MYCLE|nr:hypothetical protein [Mycobacterium leprae]CAR71858.1 hypothetical protein MLBr01763 [Mycobacterium leprae Br4923]OAR19956.1 hypothetical protein A8144_12680 [Mycobacterium leprae 3125609]OAX70330.1 hypothetical protein A3216_12620 [Mycobacterium leprae 7935681]CAC30716.1 hypothetical protein [Mycobacterium leprae]BBC17370.1 hypothetical protein JK2ML_1763 [Mycobacterium leprae Kyoto-2]
MVARLASEVLRETVADDDRSSAIFDVAAPATSVFVETFLGRTTHPVGAAGIEFMALAPKQSRDVTLREIYH